MKRNAVTSPAGAQTSGLGLPRIDAQERTRAIGVRVILLERPDYGNRVAARVFYKVSILLRTQRPNRIHVGQHAMESDGTEYQGEGRHDTECEHGEREAHHRFRGKTLHGVHRIERRAMYICPSA